MTANISVRAGTQWSLLIAMLFYLLLLVWNLITYYTGLSTLWSSCTIESLLVCLTLAVNAAVMPGMKYCWINIFVALLSLFHLGYYVPAKLGLIDPIPFMPPVDTRVSDLAITVFAAAVIALEVGAVLGALCFRIDSTQAKESKLLEIKAAAVLHSGLLVTGLSTAFLIVFLFQVGGVSSLLRLSYQDFYNFLLQNDSRFAMTGMWFLPPGMLLVYVGLVCLGSYRFLRAWKYVAAAVFFSQILLGARGGAFLMVLGYLYLRDKMEKRLSNRPVIVALLLLSMLAPIIALTRNGISSNSQTATAVRFTPLAVAFEAGGTYRPFYAFVNLFSHSDVPFLRGRSYVEAIQHLFPNVAFSERSGGGADAPDRSTVWITEMVDPISAAANIGIGSSGIAEPYANFGYLGVVAFFGLIGFSIEYLECSAVLGKDPLAFGTLAIIFVPVCWYIRDDIYSTLRGVVWPVILLIAVWTAYRVSGRKVVLVNKRFWRFLMRPRTQACGNRELSGPRTGWTTRLCRHLARTATATRERIRNHDRCSTCG